MPTERSIRTLTSAGWSPGRRVPIDTEIRALEQDGYSIFPAAVAFLGEYSGLTMDFELHGHPDSAWFSAARACAILAPAWTADYSERAGTSLLPVGAANQEHLVLLIGEDDRWFGGFDDEFGLLGEDLLACVENLIENRPFIQRL